MKLYLIRHAQSANNEACTSGDESTRTPDPEITETGHQQSNKLAKFFTQKNNEPRQNPYLTDAPTDLRISHLYCSLMTRSILTADYISKATGIRVQARDDVFERKGLYEVNAHGVMQGVSGPSRSYFEARFPELDLPDWLGSQGWWNRPVETDEEFCLRVKKSLDAICETHEKTENNDDHVALVAHGDYIDQLINALLDIQREPKNYNTHWEANWVTHNTSISRIDIESGSRNVVYLNRIDHLEPELVTW